MASWLLGTHLWTSQLEKAGVMFYHQDTVEKGLLGTHEGVCLHRTILTPTWQHPTVTYLELQISGDE